MLALVEISPWANPCLCVSIIYFCFKTGLLFKNIYLLTHTVLEVVDPPAAEEEPRQDHSKVLNVICVYST